MKLKLLLLIVLFMGFRAHSQPYIYNDTINYLVITETRLNQPNNSYLELTNMGNKPIQLNQFNFGHWGGGNTLDYVTGKTNVGKVDYRLPEKELQPGESFVMAAIYEWGPNEFAKGKLNVSEKITQDNMKDLADYFVYMDEDGVGPDDLVSEPLWRPFTEQWGGKNGFYIEQHFANGDSMVIDQVGGMFTGVNGANLDRTAAPAVDIAGVTNATNSCYLIRRAVVKKGNRNFNDARGVSIEDSEWIPIPFHGTSWRWAPWTIGNHGDFKLDDKTLESNVIQVDFATKKLTVPWGVLRGDDIMTYLKQKPGIGWEYVMGANADSLSHAAQTGDQLIIYVCGNTLTSQAFDIVVKEPAANANMVVPVSNLDPEGNWRTQIDGGSWDWPRITKNKSGNDTIWGTRGGIPYATRVDSLLERLQKPSNAKWEIVYAGGVKKPDLSNGDKIKVTAQNGAVKEYFISVINYRASTNASLSSITWPDIPEFYKGIFGWIGDTIPNFGSQVFNYNVQVPMMSQGIPALVGKTTDANAKLDVKRAISLSGTEQDGTYDFMVTAEDDTTTQSYKVVLTKEKNPENLQPYRAEPFISEIGNNWQWSGTDYMEICNPGNQPLDLSNYMLVGYNNTNPATAISATNATDYMNRYEKYIPGYKWSKLEADWTITPYKAEFDVAVNAVIQPGDVFTMGLVKTAHCDWSLYPFFTQLDVSFWDYTAACYTWKNQWGEKISENGTPFSKWHTQTVYLFKILNDSIKRGLKPATDPNDFELIDAVGMPDGSLWKVEDKSIGNPFSMIRKPEIYKGNPLVGATMGSATIPGEWTAVNTGYFGGKGFGWPWTMRNILLDFGKHYYYTPTAYISTVGSLVYKVSEGYSLKEKIRGVKTGTTVNNFLGSILKANQNQSLKVKGVGSGKELAMDALVSLNDTLVVVSADTKNTTKYILEVTQSGLSSNALLTSTRYSIKIDSQPKSASNAPTPGSGTISGFEYGTSLKTLVSNVTVPSGASLTIINNEGAPIPFKMLNFDTTYVNVTVNADTYFDVLAENGITRITYRLLPSSTESDAFILSDIYAVSQKDLLIKFVPRGTNVVNFISNLVPSFGATIKLVDKMGFERKDGQVADDDKIVVTSANKSKVNVYHISKLATMYTPNTTYLAYILSNVYGIDQVNYKIHGVSGVAPISEFYSAITASAGATAVVVDKNGVVKNTGDINGTDMVKVTSADGRIQVYYTFEKLTGAEWLYNNKIELYPNPTNGKLNVTGVEKGQRIQVYNSLGSVIMDYNVEKTHELISIDQHPAGMYMIVISNNDKLLGKYKAIKY